MSAEQIGNLRYKRVNISAKPDVERASYNPPARAS
jgi:hypothetical protein